MKEQMPTSDEGRMGLEEAQEEANLVKVIADESKGIELAERRVLTAEDYENAFNALETLRQDVENEGSGISQFALKLGNVGAVFPNSVRVILDAVNDSTGNKARILGREKVSLGEGLKKGFAKVAEEFRDNKKDIERNFSQEELVRLQEKAEKLAESE